ncbi:hypothetical protein BGX21_007315 [Mortierella sp. AD011]|nr:hypothetical protein BGX20_008302 [Mortierella sp. AD010]KAF9398748.1 hypothetical protein BGX21_007315 [Mortierella sp. AD011]
MASLSNSPITQVSQDSSPITQVSPAPSPSPSQYYIPSQHAYPTRLILDLRGTRFEIDRNTLIGLPESILVVMFPNGLILRPQTIRPGTANRGKAAASAMGAGAGASRGPLAAAGLGPGGGHGHHPSESTYTDYSDYSDYSYDDYDEDEDDYRDDPNGIHEEELDDDEQSDDYEEEEEEPQVIQVDFDPVCLQYILDFYREAQRASEAQRRLRLQEQQQMLQMQRQRLQQQQQQQLQLQKQKQSSEGSSDAKGENEEVAGVATTTTITTPTTSTTSTTAPAAAAEGLVDVQAGPSLPEPSYSQPVNLGSILPQNPLLNKQAIIVLREELDYFAIPPSTRAKVHTSVTAPESNSTTSAVIAPSTSIVTNATVATTATAITTETTSKTATSSSNVPISGAKNTKPTSPKMIKTQCGQALLEDRKIFAALQRNINKEKNQAEQHLMDMLCVSGFQRDGEWGYRRLEPKRTTVVSVAMVMLRTTAATPSSSSSSSSATATLTATTALKVANALKGINSTTPGSETQNNNSSTTIPNQATDSGSNGDNGSPNVGKSTSAGPTIQEQNQIQMAIAQKLLLFWRKPARKCWWDGIEVEIEQDINGASGVKVPVRLWARRTWTLELILV